jgi:hypothetical protein
MWGVYCPKYIYPLFTRIGFWSTMPRDKDIWNWIRKIHTVQCQDPLTSVYNSSTRNCILCSAMTYWYLCKTAVPVTMYCTVPWPTDICVQQLYQYWQSITCILSHCYLTYCLSVCFFEIELFIHLVTNGSASEQLCFVPLWYSAYCISRALRTMDLSCDSTRHVAHCMFRSAIQLLLDSSFMPFVSLVGWAPSILVKMCFFVGRFIHFINGSQQMCVSGLKIW